MLFRAIFWIGLVSILLPREPDLGQNLALDRPSTQVSGSANAQAFGGALSSAVDALVTRQVCGGEAACAPDWGTATAWQGGIWRQLAQIKADIEAQERARAARSE